MRNYRLMAATTAAILAFSSAGALIAAGNDAAPSTPSATPRTGEQLYVAHGCYQCHGYVGQGGPGPRLVPSRMNSNDFAAYVRNPRGIMPSYSRNAITDAQMAEIEAYVASFPKPRPPSNIPLLKTLIDKPASYRSQPGQRPKGPDVKPSTELAPAGPTANLARGRALYLANCAACHGAARQGGAAPELLSEANRRDAQGTIKLIQDPPPTMPRLFPAPLSSADVREIAAYIRSKAK